MSDADDWWGAKYCEFCTTKHLLEDFKPYQGDLYRKRISCGHYAILIDAGLWTRGDKLFKVCDCITHPERCRTCAEQKLTLVTAYCHHCGQRHNGAMSSPVRCQNKEHKAWGACSSPYKPDCHTCRQMAELQKLRSDLEGAKSRLSLLFDVVEMKITRAIAAGGQESELQTLKMALYHKQALPDIVKKMSELDCLMPLGLPRGVGTPPGFDGAQKLFPGADRLLVWSHKRQYSADCTLATDGRKVLCTTHIPEDHLSSETVPGKIFLEWFGHVQCILPQFWPSGICALMSGYLWDWPV